MDMKRIPVVDILAGDWLMVPPGQGKHRGKSEDSGILVVEDVWHSCGGERLIFGNDMMSNWESMINAEGLVNGEYIMCEVVR